MEFSPLCSRGGVNKELLDRISLLENEVSKLKQQKASKTEYGIVQISDSTDVTTDVGFVLGAKEKNAAVNGTVANKISQVESQCNSKISQVEEQIGKIVFGTYVGQPNGNTVEIGAPGIKPDTPIAVNGDYNANHVTVIGVSANESNIYVLLSGEIYSNIRINYIYKKW